MGEDSDGNITFKHYTKKNIKCPFAWRITSKTDKMYIGEII